MTTSPDFDYTIGGLMCRHLSKIGIDDGRWRCERCGATFLSRKVGMFILWEEVSSVSEVTTNWEKLAEMHGQTLVFAACDEHLDHGLRAIEGKTGRVVHARERDKCIDGHAPATWRFYRLGGHPW